MKCYNKTMYILTILRQRETKMKEEKVLRYFPLVLLVNLGWKQGTVLGKEFRECTRKVIRSVLLSIAQKKNGDCCDSVVTLYGICSLVLVLILLLLLLLLLFITCM
jgi:hypothetical protein